MSRIILSLLFLVSAAGFVLSYSGEESQAEHAGPYLLSDTEVVRIKEEVRQQCRLAPAEERAYPWYYHYELGLVLKSKNDWQRALDSFLEALDRRDRPQKSARIYGMWFLDYYPYYNIGLAHYHLRNWKCAVNSFRLSQTLEAIPHESSEFRKLHVYEEEAEQNLTAAEP